VWLWALGSAGAAAPASPRAAHEAWWAAFWARSYIAVTARGSGENASSSPATNATLTAALNSKYALTRYLHTVQSRGTQWPIKFNGMAFMAHATGADGGADYRIWVRPFFSVSHLALGNTAGHSFTAPTLFPRTLAPHAPPPPPAHTPRGPPTGGKTPGFPMAPCWQRGTLRSSVC
jgi:hypothetical protein